MIIYSKKRKSYLFILVIFFLIMVIPWNYKYYKYLAFGVYDKILTYDTGFSSLDNLLGGNVKDINSSIKVIKKIPNIISNMFYGVENSASIKRIHLNIKFKEYRKIIEDRNLAVKNDIGKNFTEVKCKVHFNGERINAKIRLKGDLYPHWRSLKKMSFRIKLKGNKTIFGFKTFSLHKLEARQYPFDQTFQELQQEMNNLSSTHNLVHLFVNGEDWGIMNVEEHMSKELLEKQGFKESLIVKFSNEDAWFYNYTVENKYSRYRLSDAKLNIKIYGANKYLSNNLYRRWFSYIGKEHLKTNNNLYDIDSFTKSMLLALAWNTTHVLYPSNSRYYFNPYTLSLYPITTDQAAFSKIDKAMHLPNIYEQVLRNKDFNVNFDKNINTISRSLEKSQKIMDQWQEYFPLDEKINTTVLDNNIEKLKNNFSIYLSENESDISNENFTKKHAIHLPSHIYARHFDDGNIHIYNLLPIDVNLTSISLGKNQIQSFSSKTIRGFKNKKSYNPLVIQTDLKGIYDNNITVTTNVYGYQRIFKVDYTHLTKKLYNPLQHNSVLDEIEYILKVNNGWKIKKGNWTISKPLIIDGDLEVEEGTVLNFHENSYLIVKGAIQAEGSKESNIIFKGLTNRWKGIYILNATRKSIFNNVLIQDTKALTDGLLNLTGAVTFYKSSLEIKNSEFRNSIAEDSLNIVHSDFVLENISIIKSISDGFDSDFSKGSINNSFFSNITGDAVDFSGSRVRIENSTFTDIKDKAISSGEASSLTLVNLFINNIGIAVASKDGSITVGKNIYISNYMMNAFMTYIKKPFYDLPKLELEEVTIDKEENRYFRQENTHMRINGYKPKEKKLDVKKMYQSGIMKK
ncbi:MAG: Unknown protein [uncultured Sulfurovum sp.]|uniref:Right handed beta helix domain-containing protein n=1 Tax=uncultured Sulfurovum sp. TaxID=269237 RepID=A0A6S6TLC1_9BACT|nr:MAG: Unknown protein [uncultured Sulfurovum sp.]